MIQDILIGTASGIIAAAAILFFAYRKANRDAAKYYAKSQETLKKALVNAYRQGVKEMADKAKELITTMPKEPLNGQEVKGQSD